MSLGALLGRRAGPATAGTGRGRRARHRRPRASAGPARLVPALQVAARGIGRELCGRPASAERKARARRGGASRRHTRPHAHPGRHHRRRPGRPAALPPARSARASSPWSWRPAREEYVAARIRAGILEQLHRRPARRGRARRPAAPRGHEHRGIYLQWPGERHHLDFVDLTGRSVWVYGQTEVQKDLVAAQPPRGQALLLRGGRHRPARPRHRPPVGHVHRRRRRRRSGSTRDVIAGCDGRSAPSPRGRAGARRPTWERTYPYSWLGILADVAPSTDELIYAWHPDGFALHSMRSPTVSPALPPGAPTSTDRGLVRRPDLGRRWPPGSATGRTAGAADPARSPRRACCRCARSCSTPMRHGRLFLAGDAAHIVPPTGAKGLNLAVADVALLAPALVAAAAQEATRPRRRATPTPRCAGSGGAPTSPGG